MKGPHRVRGQKPREGSHYPRPPYECDCGFFGTDLREAVDHEKDNVGREWEDDRPWPPTEEDLQREAMMDQLEALRAAAFDEGRAAGVAAAKDAIEQAGTVTCPSDDHVLGSGWFYKMAMKSLEAL